jgi:hypothetical protein
MPAFAVPAMARFFSLSMTVSLSSFGGGSAQPMGCEGDPPTLVNRDNRDYSFKVECGKKSENRQISAGESQSLKGKSGCWLVFGDKRVTLYADLDCSIQNGKLSCELG